MVHRREELKKRLTMSERTGMAAFVTSGLLALTFPYLAALPLALFVILCAAAPYFYRSSFFLPVVSRGTSGQRAVALTFDDGPDELTTPLLIELLAEHNIRAAFFINGASAQVHPELVSLILAHGHELGNHSHTHDNFLTLKSVPVIRDEIRKTQAFLMEKFGVRPLAFRPPVGIISPRLKEPLADTGMYCVNFTFRTGDAGNRRIKNISRNVLNRAAPDGIIVLHDKAPANAPVQDWLAEIESVIEGLRDKGFAILPLSELIGRPVMKLLKPEPTFLHQSPAAPKF